MNHNYNPVDDAQVCAMVRAVARQLATTTPTADVDDLMQEAWVAVLEAQRKWDPKRSKLSSYARPSVKTRTYVAAVRTVSPTTACPRSTSPTRVRMLLQRQYRGVAYAEGDTSDDNDERGGAPCADALVLNAIHGPAQPVDAHTRLEAAESKRLVRVAQVVNGTIAGMPGGAEAVRYLCGEVKVFEAARVSGATVRDIRAAAKAVREAVEAAREVIYGEA